MDSVQLIVTGVVKGIKDSICGTIVVFHLDQIQATGGTQTTSGTHKSKSLSDEEPRVLRRIFQCCMLNGVVFWLSISIFDSLVLPGLRLLTELFFGGPHGLAQSIWSWMSPVLSCTFGTLWVLPLFILSKIVNSLWFQDIADSAYRHTRGRPSLLPSLSKLVADTLFSLLIQALFLVQSMVVSLLPIMVVGQGISLLHMCLLYSLYAFEYKWFNMGWELHRRLSFIETNWPYFVGFGLPLAVLTALPESYIISGCLFSILFPLFIISGNEAQPLTGTCDFPLQLFSPVVCLCNVLFNRTINLKRPTTSFVSSHRGSVPSMAR